MNWVYLRTLSTVYAPLPLRWHAVLAVLALLTGAGAWILVMVMEIAWNAPPLDRGQLLLQQNIQVLDRRGGLLYRFYNDENRSSLPVGEIPLQLRDAIVAIEDKRFFTRTSCIDVRAIIRAYIHNQTSDTVQGGSTITQQVVRNLYLTADKTLTRKIQEAWLACRMEHTLSKEEILTLYINRIGFGGPVYGAEQAAQTFFGVSASQLTLPQIAVIAALPQQPTSFAPGGTRERTTVDHDIVQQVRKGTLSPKNIPKSAVRIGLLGRTIATPQGPAYVPGRADNVLVAMLDAGMISETASAQAHKALETIHFNIQPRSLTAPHFSLWMRSSVESLLSQVTHPDLWRTAGLTVQTTLDPALQRIAEETVREYAPLMEEQQAKDVALVALDRNTRQILAYVGNSANDSNAQTSAIDMAQEPRQPGSSFKPLLYAFAFEHGLTPDSYVYDSPLTIGNDQPKNYEGGFRGRMTIRNALAQSRNIPAIRTFLDLDDEDGLLHFIARAGAPTPLITKQQALQKNSSFQYGWPLAIGSAEIPLLELTDAFATIGSQGVALPPKAICRITDRSGTPVTLSSPTVPVQAIDPAAAMEVDDILRDSDARPDGYWRDMLTVGDLNNAAKTGTSNLCLQRTLGGKCIDYGVGNVWTLGYTDNLVVGVWVGNADGTSLTVTADGLTVAAPIWHAFLEKAQSVPSGSVACQ